MSTHPPGDSVSGHRRILSHAKTTKNNQGSKQKEKKKKEELEENERTLRNEKEGCTERGTSYSTIFVEGGRKEGKGYS